MYCSYSQGLTVYYVVDVDSVETLTLIRFGFVNQLSAVSSLTHSDVRPWPWPWGCGLGLEALALTTPIVIVKLLRTVAHVMAVK